MKIKFKRWNCTVFPTFYVTENRKAIVLKDNEGVVATTTVNMPGYPCEEDQIYVKDYSENEGMLQTLIDNKIVFPDPINVLGGNFVSIPLMQLTPKALKLWEK